VVQVMKTNYQDLPEEELNRLAGKMMGWYIEDGMYYEDDWQSVIKCKDWNPCQDAEQIQRYLFPKIAEHPMGLEVVTSLTGRTFYIKICRNQDKKLASKLTTDPDKINKTKVACCLEAWRIINE